MHRLSNLLLVFLLSTVGATAQVELSRGLLAHYPMEGSAVDVSGNGYDGGLYDATAAADRFDSEGKALYFNGETAHIRINDPSRALNFDARTDTYSISAWVWFEDAPLGYQQIIIDRGHADSFNSSYGMGYHQGFGRFYVGVVGAGAEDVNVGVVSETDPEARTWYHLVMIVANGKVSLYVNGNQEKYLGQSEIGDTIGSDYPSTRTDDTIRFIGKSEPNDSAYLKGKIDDIRIYDRALNEDEIYALLYEEESIVVNSTGDLGDADLTDNFCDTGETVLVGEIEAPECTLRAAIETTNRSESDATRTITFKIPGDGIPMILPENALPEISRSVTIDATTQSGSNKVELNGILIENPDVNGLEIADGLAVIEGLVITSFSGFGIHVKGGIGHLISGNMIGYEADGTTITPNENGGIQVSNGAREVVIGGYDEEAYNHIAGGILVVGDDTRGIRILKNVMEVPADQSDLLIDLSEGPEGFGDGPSCVSWDRTDRNGPNGWMPAPRILETSPTRVYGVSSPAARIVLYEVQAEGMDRRRYFARKVRPVAYVTADPEGFFNASVALPVGTLVAATAMDVDGNTSELSQLKRPVVFIPDIGGTWLRASDGTNLWPPFDPIAGSTADAEARLARLAMSENGISQEFVEPYRLLERYIDIDVYGPVLQRLAENGYAGDVDNADVSTQDLWRFPYDWRDAPGTTALELSSFLFNIVDLDIPAHPWCCEVDLVAHGAGAYGAALMLRENASWSRTHINRMVTVGTGWLGTPLGLHFHARGGRLLPRIFNQRSIDPDPGFLMRLYRNMPAFYALMPSRDYFEVIDHVGYLENIVGVPVDGWQNTSDFLSADKWSETSTITGRRLADHRSGLARNRTLLSTAQGDVHAKLDDWSGWRGPPFVNMMVGDLARRTPIRWVNLNVDLDPDDENEIVERSMLREDQDDANATILYREGLAPILGSGDGVAPLISSMLHDRVPENWWSTPSSGDIFLCGHIGILFPGCTNYQGEESTSLLIRTLQSGYRIVDAGFSELSAAPGSKHLATDKSETFYILSSGPTLAYVKNQSGERTGRTSADSLGQTKTQLSEVDYWGSLITHTLAVPASGSYSIESVAALDTAYVRVYRIKGEGDMSETIIFDEQKLAPGGSVAMALMEGGTPKDTPLDIDADGDGTFELAVAPAATIEGADTAPAVPRIAPTDFDAEILRAESEVAELTLQIGTNVEAAWEWELTGLPDWMFVPETTGLTPSSMELIIDSYELDEGRYTDTLAVEFTYQNFTFASAVVIRVEVRDEVSCLARIVVSPDSVQLEPGGQQQFVASGFDQIGDAFDISPSWSATGGSINADGLYTAGQTGGDFVVQAWSSDQTVVGEAQVSIAGSGVDREGETPPFEFYLEAGYPNPVRDRLTLSFGLDTASPVRLEIRDILGKVVALPGTRTYQAGSHRVTVDMSGLASGSYLVRLTAGNRSAVRRITVVR